MARRHLQIEQDSFPLTGDFVISRGSRTQAEVVTVTIEEDGILGRGEGTPISRYGETQASTIAAIEAMQSALVAGLDRKYLQQSMPPGAARNAIDCALWDLEAKQAGRPIWELCDIVPPPSITTAFTLSLGEPAAMAEAALVHRSRPLLKLKLGGNRADIARIEAVRRALPSVRLIVDANEAVAPEDIKRLLDAAADLGVELVEQPLPAGRDEVLATIARPVPVAADESCHTRADLDGLKGRYDMVNIKLDKTGGLTEAIALESAARIGGFSVMVGCMVSSSLGIAPAQLVAAHAELVDLDSPLYLERDRGNAITYDGSEMALAKPVLWG